MSQATTLAADWPLIIGSQRVLPENLSSAAFPARAITPVPEVKVAWDAPEPEPLRIEGPVMNLSYAYGDRVVIQEDRSNGRLIAALSRIYVRDAGGTVQTTLSLGTGGNEKGDAYDHVGGAAEQGYEYTGGYDVTGFAQTIAIMRGGLGAGEVMTLSLQLVGEVDKKVEREPAPPQEEEEDEEEDSNGDGGGGSSGGEGSSDGGGGLGGVGVGWGWGLGGGAGTPTPPQPYKETKDTYATTRMVAYVINNLDLAVSHAVRPDEYISEQDEDEIGGVTNREEKDEQGQPKAPEKSSKLALSKGSNMTAKQILTWDDEKLVIMDGAAKLTSPHEFNGNARRELNVYGKESFAGQASVSLRGQDANGEVIGGDNLLVTVVEARLAVDANRDQEMDVDGNSDRTESNKPYRFWLNDDEDNSQHSYVWSERDPELIPAKNPDGSDYLIKSARDCEDLTRVWFSLEGLNDLVKSQDGDVYIGLKWNETEGSSPAIRLFHSADETGGLGHIKNMVTAQKQKDEFAYCLRDQFIVSNFSYKYTLPQYCQVPANGGELADFVFNKDDLSKMVAKPADLSAGRHRQYVYLLYEGVKEGKGRLDIVLLKKKGVGNFEKIGELSGPWLELKNIRRMYERAHSIPTHAQFPLPIDSAACDTPPPFPYELNSAGALTIPDANLAYGMGDSEENVSQYPHEAAWDEENKCVVFVHGIDLTVPVQQNYAQSFYKRLWWEGYRGRFAAFRWSTILDGNGTFLLPGQENFSLFNSGEYRSFKSAASLRKYMASLRARMGSNAVIGLAAHSLGNVCASEALRQGMTVDSYVAMEAAVAASCYYAEDSNDVPEEGTLVAAEQAFKTANGGVETPRFAGQKGYHGYFHNIQGNAGNSMVSYYNANDFWLVAGRLAINLSGADGVSVDLPEVSWLKNNRAFKPDNRIGYGMYGVNVGNDYWFSRTHSAFVYLRNVTDSHEVMPYVSRSRTSALGAATKVPPNFSNSSVDLADQYGFDWERSSHSGQFQRDIQLMYGNENGNPWISGATEESLYRRLIKDLKVD